MTNDEMVRDFIQQFASEDTRTTYLFGIELFRRFVSDIPFANVTVSDVSGWKKSLTGKPATIYTRWCGPSSLFSWIALAGYIERNPFAVVKGPQRTRNRAPLIPTDEDMHSLIGLPGAGDWRSRRDRTVVALCANGLRIAEVTVLTWDDLIASPEGYTLRVVGKGDRERLIPLSAFCVEAITDWASSCGDATGRMFTDYADRTKPMTTAQVQAAFGRVAKSCGIQGLSPRLLRSHYATRLIRAGANVFSVQQLMGHEDISTTQVYVRLDLTDLRKAASLDKLA